MINVEMQKERLVGTNTMIFILMLWPITDKWPIYCITVN